MPSVTLSRRMDPLLVPKIVALIFEVVFAVVSVCAVAILLFGCSRGFTETFTPAGTPNLVRAFAGTNGLWRMGQPPSPAAWGELVKLTDASLTASVVVVKLNDAAEGSDDAAAALGWTVVRVPMPPEDDKPWTIFVKPKTVDVERAVAAIVNAHARGATVLWHCSHGRDRTGLVSALVGRALFGWSKDQMAQDMTSHGFRWIDVDLSAYFEDVRKAPTENE